MAGALANAFDVADLWRPLTPAEQPRVASLIAKASALLRQKVPWVDERIARFAVNPDDPGGLDPVTVATVVATVVKRFLVNPDGATNTSETTGPYSRSQGFALRGDKDVRGELVITDSDIAALTPAVASPARLGVIKAKAGLGPCGLGDASPGDLAGLSAVEGYGPIGDGWLTPDPGY